MLCDMLADHLKQLAHVIMLSLISVQILRKELKRCVPRTFAHTEKRAVKHEGSFGDARSVHHADAIGISHLEMIVPVKPKPYFGRKHMMKKIKIVQQILLV